MNRAEESERVAELLERLLTDAAFRRAFRRDPVAACRAYELVDLAEELEATAGTGLQTLEIRESKSSLAGVLLAAAAEGVGVAELVRYVHGSHGLPPDLAAPVHKVLTSPNLHAVVPGAHAAEHAAVAPEHAVGAARAAAAAAAPHPVDPAVHHLLNHPHVALSADAQHDLAAGNTDPRVVSVLGTVSEHRQIGVGTITSGPVHSGALTASHAHGRALDIVSVDGQPVDSANVGARELAAELGGLHPSIRPSEIGSPWPIDGDGYVSGADHEDHIHIGYASAQQTADDTPGAVPASGMNIPEPTGPRSTLGSTPAVASPEHHVDAVAATGHASVLPDVSDAYPGDGAPREQIAAWMARQAHKAGLPGELPVMASLVESGMHNVQGGDRDSVGFFQMRTGIWDEGPYAGFQQHPELQLKWFIDHALAVKRERLAHGDTAFMQDSSQWGNWIADVERPAEEYRGRYQLRLDEAQGLLRDSGPATPPAADQYAQPSLSPSAPVAPSATAPPIAIVPQHAGGALADAVSATAPVPAGAGLDTMTIDGIKATGSPAALKALETAFSFKGTPYHWGGSAPQTGFDCSGLTQWAYKQAGFDISRVTYTQVNDGVAVQPDFAHLQAGDLLFFRDSSGDNHHTGMYIGNGMMIHAPHTGDVVKVSSLNEPYYKEQLFAARRIAPPDPNAVSAPTAAPVAPQAAAPVAPAADVTAPAAEGAPPAPASAVLKAVAAPAPSGPRSTVKFLPAIDPTERPQQQVARLAPTTPPPVAETPAPADAADVAAAAAGGIDAYPGDGASREQIAAWMAQQAQKAGLPRELPVMASLVESGLTNIQGGDRDSVGFFQMRTGIWDEGPYAGFQQHPELQLKWFIDQAVAVRDRRLRAGDNAFINDPNKWGDWIADVERPAEEYRGRYQLRLDEAQQLLGPDTPA
ncbi:MAG TPA: NlpC/P60 family protein [Gaiellaceae bacterium]|nr:NlpC/P60 family protein [Gaiellaceae bacterium]